MKGYLQLIIVVFISSVLAYPGSNEAISRHQRYPEANNVDKRMLSAMFKEAAEKGENYGPPRMFDKAHVEAVWKSSTEIVDILENIKMTGHPFLILCVGNSAA